LCANVRGTGGEPGEHGKGTSGCHIVVIIQPRCNESRAVWSHWGGGSKVCNGSGCPTRGDLCLGGRDDPQGLLQLPEGSVPRASMEHGEAAVRLAAVLFGARMPGRAMDGRRHHGRVSWRRGRAVAGGRGVRGPVSVAGVPHGEDRPGVLLRPGPHGGVPGHERMQPTHAPPGPAMRRPGRRFCPLRAAGV